MPAGVPTDLAARLAHAIDRSPVAAAVLLDADLNVTWMSRSAEWVIGAGPEGHTGRTGWDRVHPDDMDRLVRGIQQVRKLGRVGTPAAPVVAPVRFRFRRYDDRWIVLEGQVHDLLDDPDVRGILVEARPVAGGLDGVGHVVDLLVAEAPTADVLAACAGLVPDEVGSAAAVGFVGDTTIVGALDGSPGRILSDDDGWWRSACESGVRHTPAAFAGFRPDLVERARALGFRTAWVLPLTDRSSAEVMGCLAVWLPQEMEPTTGVELSLQQAMRLAGMVVSETRRRHALHREATTDPLTGLGNRSALRQRLDEAGAGPVTLALVDLDGFKPVNDTYGHAVGDVVLREVAGRLREAVRSDDLVVRFGGDEFAIVFAGDTPPERAAHLAERIVTAIDRPIAADGRSLAVGASVGLATAPPDKVVHEADTALYAAKREKAEGRAG
ncbi:MAG TPA: sensor domain-containing diguanylate cyclase [Acidimicrobiales bacterium]